MIRSLQKQLVGDLSDDERSVLLHGAAWFFLIMFSYYILRPIREQISSTYSRQDLSIMFWIAFAVMLLAVPLYSTLVGRFHRRVLVPSIYVAFIILLFLFWAGKRSATVGVEVRIDQALFVWISVFGLFVVSLFWSVIGDMLSTSQGRRIFGVMAGGGTLGGMAGSQFAGRAVSSIGTENLLLIPACSLALALAVYASLEAAFRRTRGDAGITMGKATGGNPFAGFTAVFRSRYLMAICGYSVLLGICGTTVYFQQSEIVKSTYAQQTTEASEIEGAANMSAQDLEAAIEKQNETKAKAAKTKYFADVNFAVSCVTIVFQFFIVGWVMRVLGVGVALAILPIAYVIGISSLALSPTIAVLAIVSVIGRSAEYGICNPAREVLFTSVQREDRYKAKSFIDTVGRRTGDSVTAGVYELLRSKFLLTLGAVSWITLPLAVGWVALAAFLGWESARQSKHLHNQDASPSKSDLTDKASE